MTTSSPHAAAASRLAAFVMVAALTSACAKLPPAPARSPVVIPAPPSAVWNAVQAQFHDSNTAIQWAQPASGIVSSHPMGLSALEGRVFASCVSTLRAPVPADVAVYHASVGSGPDSTTTILSTRVDWSGDEMKCVTTGQWERWFEAAVRARVLGTPVPPYDPNASLVRVDEAARLFAEADVNSKVLHRFLGVTDVLFLSADDEWVRVQFGDLIGYVPAGDTRR